MLWTARASVATLEWVSDTARPDDQRTRSQCVRFSFESATLRQAVEVAGQLRRVTRNGVRVRPARFSDAGSTRCDAGSTRWAILVTTPPLAGDGIGDLEDAMHRVARQVPEIRFTGWLCLFGPIEAAPARESNGSVRAPLRVLIVDESAPSRQEARELLERRGFSVVGEADGAAAGFDAVERLKPDAVLLDVQLFDGSGFDLCEVLTREETPPAVLLMSGNNHADGVRAKACGARGFVSKADLAQVDLRGIWGSVARSRPRSA